MALVDANHKFTCIDTGDYGSNADGSVFKICEFGKAFIHGDLDVPDPQPLPNYNDSGPVPFCFVGDVAFPLQANLMRPFPRKERSMPDDKLIFNCRLTRACRIVENAFGILAQRFRVFARGLQLIPDNVDKIVKVCCVLHNFLRGYQDIHTLHQQLNPDNQPFLQDDGVILAFNRLHGYHSAHIARQIRDLYKNYFMSPDGQVPWQRGRVGR